MDISEQEESNKLIAKQRFEEGVKRAGFWNPSTINKQKMYKEWLTKQIDQRQKTIELDGATHSRDYKDILRHEKKAYVEEAKRIKDLIKDGK